MSSSEARSSEASTSSKLFATWRLLNASSDVLADHVAASLDLLVLEWQAERDQVLRLLLMTLLTTSFLLLLIGFSGMLLLSAVWDTPLRIPVAILLLLGVAAGAWLCWRKTRELSARGTQPFASFREELAKDRALFRSQTHEVR